MLAVETAFAGAGALNANFPRFCNNSGLSGIDNIADVRSKALLVTALRPSTVIRALPKRAESGH